MIESSNISPFGYNLTVHVKGWTWNCSKCYWIKQKIFSLWCI